MASEPRVIAILPSSWPRNKRPINVSNRSAPFGKSRRLVLLDTTTRSVFARGRKWCIRHFAEVSSDHQSAGAQLRVKWKHHAQARNHSSFSERVRSQPSVARRGECGGGRSHIGRYGLSDRLCADIRRETGLACGEAGNSDDPPHL